METKPSLHKSDPLPRPSLDRHRRQRAWQILAPIVVSGLLLLAMAVLVILTATQRDPSGHLSVWADTSLIWLLLPVMGVVIFIVVFLAALIYLIGQIIKFLPPYTALGQRYGHLIATGAKKWSDKIASPFIRLRSVKAGMDRLMSGLRRK